MMKKIENKNKKNLKRGLFQFMLLNCFPISNGSEKENAYPANNSKQSL